MEVSLFYGKKNKSRIARKLILCYDTYIAMRGDVKYRYGKEIVDLCEKVGENRKDFSVYTGISAEISSILGFVVENE